MAVDPSAQTVLQLIRKHSSSMPPQRVLIHYFGHGCHPPTDDGSLYFFSEDRARYKPIKVTNLLNSCTAPVCAIIDAPNAGSLYRFFSAKADVFAFFACSAGETLPLSTDAPLDLFSSCLLTPYDTALWFHRRHHSCVHEMEGNAAENAKEYMKKLLDSILEAILFDTQAPQTFDKYSKDPSVFSLCRGFALSQRILTTFNIHSSAYPEIKQMCSHPLWGMWDTVLDCALTMNIDRASDVIFNIFITSFDSFPSTSMLPILSYYLKTEFHLEAVRRLLTFIDTTEGSAATAARSSIPQVIVSLEKPSALSLIVLAKTISTSKTTPFDQQTPVCFTGSKDSGVIRAGMCCLCCSIATSPALSFNRLTQICIDRSSQCAPYSALLLGLLVERAGRLMNLPPFVQKFAPLLKSRKQEVRASVIFLLGNSREGSTLDIVAPFLADKNPLVRCQAVWSVCKLMKATNNFALIDSITSLQGDKDASVRLAIETLIPYFTDENLQDQPLPQNQVLVQMLMNSVEANGFIERFEGDVFMTDV